MFTILSLIRLVLKQIKFGFESKSLFYSKTAVEIGIAIIISNKGEV